MKIKIGKKSKWTDNIGLSGYIFSFDNCTGSFVNDTWVGWVNITQYNQASSTNITGNASTIDQTTINSYLNTNADGSTWNITEIQTGTINLTDYQVNVTLDTAYLISQGKMRSDCGDIRFTYSNGETQLNYWLESDCNSASTKLWVKVPSIPASGTKTIYVYYWNASALLNLYCIKSVAYGR